MGLSITRLDNSKYRLRTTMVLLSALVSTVVVLFITLLPQPTADLAAPDLSAYGAISLHFERNEGQLEYDFVVAPNVDPARIHVDDNQNIYMVGQVQSADFPTENAVQPIFGGSSTDAFVMRLAPICGTVVTNLNDSGTGSLRSAIDCANLLTGTNTISFTVAGTINVATELPELNDFTGGTTVDGATAPGYTDAPLITIAGPGTGSNVDGINVVSSDNVIRGLQIVNFTYGVEIQGSLATGTTVVGNYIGTDGTTAMPNVIGVRITNAANNTVGGTSIVDRNVISGNLSNGVLIQSLNATGNTIIGNYIGVDVNGQAALGNLVGIAVTPPGNTIGGVAAGAGNVVSGNSGNGLTVGFGTQVLGNLIGTNSAGTGAIPNARGMQLIGDNNQIGGATAAARNIISGNTLSGILLSNNGHANLIEGNLIGTNISGTLPLPNLRQGIEIVNTHNNTIGSPGAGNVIAGNGWQGISITGSNPNDNVIQGNFIGTGSTATLALGNGFDGILTHGDNTMIGGINGEANVIANNGIFGVNIAAGTGSSILSNQIFANGDLGIELAAGGQVNDPDDADTGANNLQNFPMLTAAAVNGTNMQINGTLDSTPSMTFTVQFFVNAACDASGFGEGAALVGSAVVTTDLNGDASFSTTYPSAAVTGSKIAATATDADGNSSEFSACVVAIDANQPPIANDDQYVTDENMTLAITDSNAVTHLAPQLPADLQLSSGNGVGAPAPVAFDGNRYLALYAEDGDIFGRFVDINGTPLPAFIIATGSGLQYRPSITFNGTHYLVAYYNNGAGRIEGQVVDTSGNLLGLPLQISTASNVDAPQVASDGTGFLIVWKDNRNNATNFADIYGQFVDVSAGGVAALSGGNFMVSPAAENQFSPAIAYGGGSYLVTWTNDFVVNGGQFDVKGALVTPSGSVGTPLDISTASGVQGSREAGIAYGNTQFLVVFDDFRNGGSGDIYGARISSSGVLLDGPALTGGIAIETNPGAGSPHRPKAAFDGSGWLVLWGGTDIQGKRVATDGVVIDPTATNLFVASDSQWDPSVASDGDNFLITWRDSPNPYNKYAQLVAIETIMPGDTLSNDSDPDNDPLDAILDSSTGNGALALQLDGSFVYTPTAAFCGTDEFAYYANDGSADSNLATVTITVNCVNDPPVALNDAATVNEDDSITVDVLSNDTDLDLDALTIISTTAPANGTRINNGSDVTYTPNADFCGTDSFSYTLSDGNGGQDAATVTITVNCINDAPSATDDLFVVNQDSGPISLNLVANDSILPDDGETLTIVALGTPSLGGTVTNLGSTIDYQPAATVNGSETFTYTIDDGNGGTDTATVTVTIMATEADLAVTIDDSADPAPIETSFVYSVTVANGGPMTATGVALTLTLPVDSETIAIVTSQGSCTDDGMIANCSLGALAVGNSAEILITIMPEAIGIISSSALVSANQPDPNLVNNSDSESTLITTAYICNGVAATLIGTAGDDILVGTSGDDIIVGLGGNDIISGGGGDDIICGGTGNDQLAGGNGQDLLKGGRGADTLKGNRGADILRGGRGADTLHGGRGMDILYGGRGSDTLRGGAQNDTLYGNQGADTLLGGSGDDELRGNQGDDVLTGNSGQDILFGGANNDLLNGNGGVDQLNGGSGVDTCRNGENVLNCEA